MTKNNSTDLSLWRMFLKRGKRFVKSVRKTLRNFSQKYPDIAQVIQLTFIYFFAVVDLHFAVLTNVFQLGYMPKLILPVLPIVQAILQNPILKIWASPEKVFFLSYVVIEFMVVRSTFRFSKLIKYNILLIFALLMLQGLAISYWDVLFHREIATAAVNWSFEEKPNLQIDRTLAVVFFFNTFVIFMVTYFYLYIRAISGKFATIPYMEWLTDSVAFWLRIRTPTMRFGKRKKRK